MWEYRVEKYNTVNPGETELQPSLDYYGNRGWEIFQIDTRVVREWNVYGEPMKEVEYTFYMKRKFE
jgi:hypothetical protein